MTEFQLALLVIGALVVAGVFAYNRLQESRARRAAERAFRSGHADALLGGAPTAGALQQDTPRPSARAAAPDETAQPDARIDYVVTLVLDTPATQPLDLEPWRAIERRHAPRALLAGSADGTVWRAGLQLVTRDGPLGEADLIEFRASVETLAASLGASVSAPEMRAAVDAARELDGFCADADVQVVLHLTGGPFPGSEIRAAAQAGGLALDAEGRFALRDERRRLLYTLGARDGAAFAPGTLDTATPAGLSITLDVPRAPGAQRTFQAMAEFARQLAVDLGGSLVDDNDRVLDERSLAAIETQLATVCAAFAARDIEPGSDVALRLFS